MPVTPTRDRFGVGAYPEWLPSVTEVPAAELRRTDFDIALLQRPEEIDLLYRWTGRRPGMDVPTIYLEHDAPSGAVPNTPHMVAERADIPLVHVTHFNALMWDNGMAPTRVIELGVPDPGYRYSGVLERSAVVVNEAARRGRFTGTDLIPRFAQHVPIDLFGIDSAKVPEQLGLELGTYDLKLPALFDAIPTRRLYLHLNRWTSAGMSLIEAMHLGMPVVALATTAVADAVGTGTGFCSNDLDVLTAGIRELLADPGLAADMGRRARQRALDRFSLHRLIADWERAFDEVARPG
ncbi:glycosyltransferase [Nonomuraea insulae]|uniref:Glycosyltransferase n=1 Tax=Nonomuraea insulae TaxID=1616787 RepID=A0ABW1D9I6_9ACTN